MAAHITAASPGGPRYDSSLTSEDRKSIGNGIWLCQSCAKLVDNDEIRYTKEVIFQWKQGAEQETLREVESLSVVGRWKTPEPIPASPLTGYAKTVGASVQCGIVTAGVRSVASLPPRSQTVEWALHRSCANTDTASRLRLHEENCVGRGVADPFPRIGSKEGE